MEVKDIKKLLFGLCFAVIGFVLLTKLTFAATTKIPSTIIYGPFSSGSTDSGTCGPDWATDTYDRYFVVNTKPNAGGTYNVTEQFKNGTFVTIAGQSPGACQSSTDNGSTIEAGIIGKMQGSFEIVVTGGTYKPSADCTTGCDTTAGFIKTVFGSLTYDTPIFNFHYNAANYGDWKNASLNRGGNEGDICSQCFVETLSVPADSATGVSSVASLDLGRNYKFVVIGTADAGDNITFDAKYSIHTGYPLVWTDEVAGYESYGPSLLDLLVNGADVDWGVFNTSHLYTYELMGTGVPATFMVNDIYPSNNVGNLTVNIYELP